MVFVVSAGTIDSTNAEALRRATLGEAGPLWIWAGEQGSGRGRRARVWASPPGNLYATLLLTLDGPATRLTEIGHVAGLAVHDAVSGFLAGRDRQVALKWPNDLLVDGEKISGLLIESVGLGTGGPWSLAVGIGINLASHPRDAAWPATDLAALGVVAEPAVALERLADDFARWLAVWRQGDGGERLRRSWAERVAGVGETITVALPEETLTGRFAALDDTGALVLHMTDGTQRRIMAGDVFLPRGDRPAHLPEVSDAGAS
jgi:BirA family biotin operon repressor/biotin-[acetyl-CoA-carboxylase] ligase